MISKKPKKKFNSTLMAVIVISLGVHLLALVIFGSYTLVKMVLPDEAQFEEPAPVEEVEPPADVKVEIKPQKAPPPQQSLNNLKMAQVGNIAVAAVDVNLPSMDQSFTVSGGLGQIGSGNLLGSTRGNIGIGMSDVNVFGLKTRAERILFVIDANKSMLVDEKGGLNSYGVIKEEITNMVGNLSAGTLFNVAFVAGDRFKFFRNSLVPAGVEITNELERWIQPINANINSLGLRGGTVRPRLTGLIEHPVHKAIASYGRNRTEYLRQVFLEQSVDAIFYITGGFSDIGNVSRNLTPEEYAERREALVKFHKRNPDYHEKMAAYQVAVREARAKASELHEKNQARRKAKGLPPQVLTRDIIQVYNVKVDATRPNIPSDVSRNSEIIEKREVEKYFDELVEVLYENKGGEPPSMNYVIFLAGDEEFPEQEEDAIKDFVREFNGDFRVIRGLDEIRDAATARDTKN